jgi:heme oxygenase
LRSATRDLHRRLDHHPVLAPLAGPATTSATYQRALVALYAITSPVETAVGDYRGSRDPFLSYGGERRMPALVADLRCFGLTPPDAAWAGPSIETDGELIGCLYVLEGATRGGTVIFRRMHRVLGITEERGGRFFYGYGDQGEQLWREFWRFADEICPRELWPKACQAATTLLTSFLVLLDDYLDL